MQFLTNLGKTGLFGDIGAGFSNQTQNTNSSQNTTQNVSTSGTGTTTRNLTPYQTALQAPLFDYIRKLMTPGGATAAVAPYAAQARDQANSTYGGLADSLRQQFLATGGGTSGKYGMALAGGNLARLGALQGVDTEAATTAAALPLTAASLAQQMLGQTYGQTTTQAGTETATGSATGSSKTGSSGFNLSI